MSALSKIKAFIRKLVEEPEDDKAPSKARIWGVVEGPISREDFPEEELWNEGVEDDWEFMVVVRLEVDGEMGFCNMWYSTLDEAYQLKKYFDTNIEPLEIDDWDG